MSTASSIRSGECDSCFPKNSYLETTWLPNSFKLKDNFLAAYAEVDEIDWELNDEIKPDRLQNLVGRLVTIQDFNNATADYIVKRLNNWNEIKATVAEKHRDAIWGEVCQLQRLGPLSEQFSQKIARIFQKAPLVGFQACLTPPVKILDRIPHQSIFTWSFPKIVGEEPKKLDAALLGTQSTPSSNATVSIVEALVLDAATIEPAVTARIVVNYECGDTDRLFIRGTGPFMSWGPGIEMQREGTSRWIYESTEPFETFEFKVALNDKLWEAGNENHKCESGKPVELSTVTFHDLS
jgi:hypothetical protein